MTGRRSVSMPLAMLACAAAIATSLVAVRGQSAGQTAVRVDSDDIGGVVTGPARAGGRRLGHRRNDRAADAAAQDRRHRRPGPLPRARPAQGELRRLGPRLRPGGFGQDQGGAGQAAQPDGGAGAERQGGGRVLPGAVLAVAAARAAEERLPRHRPERQRHLAEHQEPGRVDPQRRQHRRLHRLPSDGQQGHARDPEERSARSTTSTAAWERRVQSGQAGAGMLGALHAGGKARAHWRCGRDWTDRIAAGALPATAPPRPQGRERNVVITMWDWADPKAYLHDEIATDKRNPTVNANGPIYGAHGRSADYMPVVLPKTNGTEQVTLQVRDPKTPRPGAAHAAVAVLGRRSRSGRRRAPRTASRWTARAACGSRRASARTRRPSSAARGPAIRRRRCSRSSRAAARCRCTTRRRRR